MINNDLRFDQLCLKADAASKIGVEDLAVLADVALLFGRSLTAKRLIDDLYCYFDGGKRKNLDRVLSELTHAAALEDHTLVFSPRQLQTLRRVLAAV